MSRTFYPANNAEFLIWLDNFIKVASANKAELDLSDEKINELKALQTLFNNQLNDQQAKKEASSAATILVGASRKDWNIEVGSLNAMFKANKNVTAHLLESMGLHAHGDSAISSVPVAPVDLVVSGSSNGTNNLKFGGGGNVSRTNYIIEAKTGDANTYSFVAVTTKTRYEHKNQTPGLRVFYRVKAARNDSESSYSNEAVIYN
ncbi:MAG TPA: hypothetical protein VGC76_15775 [Pyrinomonadaceae bacterium]|jgi:hypothetical protein